MHIYWKTNTAVILPGPSDLLYLRVRQVPADTTSRALPLHGPRHDRGLPLQHDRADRAAAGQPLHRDRGRPLRPHPPIHPQRLPGLPLQGIIHKLRNHF